MESKALSVLNNACVEVGVCRPATGKVAEDGGKKVVELFHPDKPWKGLVILWGDNRTTVCWKKQGEKDVSCCYTTEKPEEQLYYAIQAFYTEPGEKFGFRVRELHKE